GPVRATAGPPHGHVVEAGVAAVGLLLHADASVLPAPAVADRPGHGVAALLRPLRLVGVVGVPGAVLSPVVVVAVADGHGRAGDGEHERDENKNSDQSPFHISVVRRSSGATLLTE